MNANAETVRLSIGGMTCAACSTRIEKVLSRQQGVLSAQVNLATERATVAFAPGEVPLEKLVEAVERAGYRAELAPTEASERRQRERAAERHSRRELGLLVAGVLLTAPLVLPMLLLPLGVELRIPGPLQLLLATPVQLVLGARFYRGAVGALRSGSANMDVLVALGTSTAYLLSIWLLVEGHAHLYFEASAAVITLVMLGKWLEGRAKRSTTQAIRALMELRPERARILRDGVEIEVPLESVGSGAVVLVRPGEKVPVDGEILRGESQLDESLLTGESMPVTRGPGEFVFGGALNGDGALEIAATEVGESSLIARIVRLIEDAQAEKPPIQHLVDRISGIFVPAVIVVALVTVLAWLFLGADPVTALINGASVLVIACPCALGLATPAALMVGTGAAARAGILIRDAEALERMDEAEVVVFDKTGTLTLGRPEVEEILSVSGDTMGLLSVTAAAQIDSEHPLGQAVVREASARGLVAPRPDAFKALPGRGVEATVAGRTLLIGSRRLMQERGIALGSLETEVQEREARGMSSMWVAEGSQVLGAILAGDPPRPGASAALAALKASGIEPIMLTGDRRAAAEVIAANLGGMSVLAEVLPEDKVREVERLRAEGRVVAMVGDGVNDAPALAAADVGLAMATGADVAMHAASITLMRPELRLVADAISISRSTRRKIRQNLFWAFIYNVVGIPLAAMGFLSPMFAGGAMAMSSVSVVSNALLLRRWRPSA